MGGTRALRCQLENNTAALCMKLKTVAWRNDIVRNCWTAFSRLKEMDGTMRSRLEMSMSGGIRRPGQARNKCYDVCKRAGFPRIYSSTGSCQMLTQLPAVSRGP